MQEKGRKGQKSGKTIYDDSLKIAIAREYLTGQYSFGQLAKKYDLPNKETPRYFVNWYKNWLSLQDSKQVDQPLSQSKDAIELSEQLRHANLRITALELLIKNAEKELGVDIVKKPGTKQQGK
jgi:transposase-like protein